MPTPDREQSDSTFLERRLLTAGGNKLRSKVVARAFRITPAFFSSVPSPRAVNRRIEPCRLRTLCELALNADAFNWRMIPSSRQRMGRTVRHLWIDDFEQKPACFAWMGVMAPFSNFVTRFEP